MVHLCIHLNGTGADVVRAAIREQGVRCEAMGQANRARTTEMGCAEGADCGFVRKAYSFYIMTMIDENFT